MKHFDNRKWTFHIILVLLLWANATLDAAQLSPPPRKVVSVALQQDHKIAPLEVLDIDIFGEQALSKDYTLQASGKISFPLMGEVWV